MNQVFAIDSTKTLGEIAALYPQTIPLLAERGLDFCCGGGLSLRSASEAAGMAVEPLVAALEARIADAAARSQAPLPTWQPGQLGELVDFILARFHEGHRAAFPAIRAMMTKVARVHGGKHGQVVALAREAEALIADLEPHMLKEETVLFPWIRDRVAGRPGKAGGCIGTLGVAAPIELLTAEHETAGAILTRMRDLANGYHPWQDACRTTRALYGELLLLEREVHLHIHLENNVLFPMVFDLERDRRPSDASGHGEVT